jgi:hypothetical protein
MKLLTIPFSRIFAAIYRSVTKQGAPFQEVIRKTRKGGRPGEPNILEYSFQGISRQSPQVPKKRERKRKNEKA